MPPYHHQNPAKTKRLFAVISAARVFRSDEDGLTWRSATLGLKSPFDLPDLHAEVFQAVRNIIVHPSFPGSAISGRPAATLVRVILPMQLCTPTDGKSQIALQVEGPATTATV